MTPRQTLDQAKQSATAQRSRLRQAAAHMRERLTPGRLVSDAKTGAREQLVTLKNDSIAHARAHPLLTLLGVTAILAWVARKPLMAHAPAAAERTYAWLSGKLGFSEYWLTMQTNDATSGDESPPDNDNEELPHG